MLKLSIRYPLWFALCLVATWPVWAAPSVRDIEALLQQGNLSGARVGIEQVIQEHPTSAKAYYLYAQVLHAQGHNPTARQALETAERLDPTLSFANPDYLRRLKAELGLAAATAPAPTPSAPEISRGSLLLPLLGLGLLVLVLLGVKNAYQRQQRRRPLPLYSDPTNPAYGSPPPYGYLPPQPGRRFSAGAGFLGGLLGGALLGNWLGHSAQADEPPLESHSPEGPADENPRRFDTDSLGQDWDDSGASADPSSDFDSGGDSDW